MATSAPSPAIFLTVSGVAATRGSSASISAGTATFIFPPASAFLKPRVGGQLGPYETARRPQPATAPQRARYRSGEEVRHQNQNDDHHRDGSPHQPDKQMIGPFMSGHVVAAGARVFDLAVVGHRFPPIVVLRA